MRKLRLRKVKSFAQGHTFGESGNVELNRGLTPERAGLSAVTGCCLQKGLLLDHGETEGWESTVFRCQDEHLDLPWQPRGNQCTTERLKLGEQRVG